MTQTPTLIHHAAKTFVKVCGLTRERDVDAAVEAGAHYIGFILYSASPRHVSIARARMLVERLPAHVSPVLVLVNADALDVTAIHDYFTATEQHFVIQFHGQENAARCAQVAQTLQRPYWRAAGLPTSSLAAGQAPVDLTQALVNYAEPFLGAQALLLDSAVTEHASSALATPIFGGSGQQFDWDLVNWSQLKQSAPSRLVLSGGLNAANVIDGIVQTRPWAVDVSSGVEVRLGNGQLQRGIKDPEKIVQFVNAVGAADAQLNAVTPSNFAGLPDVPLPPT